MSTIYKIGDRVKLFPNSIEVIHIYSCGNSCSFLATVKPGDTGTIYSTLTEFDGDTQKNHVVYQVHVDGCKEPKSLTDFCYDDIEFVFKSADIEYINDDKKIEHKDSFSNRIVYKSGDRVKLFANSIGLKDRDFRCSVYDTQMKYPIKPGTNGVVLCEYFTTCSNNIIYNYKIHVDGFDRPELNNTEFVFNDKDLKMIVEIL